MSPVFINGTFISDMLASSARSEDKNRQVFDP